MPDPASKPANILEYPKQSSLFNKGFDSLWETMQAIGYSMSGMPYRPAGTISANGDLWSSLEADLAGEYLSNSRGYAQSLDNSNFATNQALIVSKILSSLPGDLGNDPGTRLTVKKISEYVAKWGPMVIGSLRANISPDDDAGGAISSILDIAESALDASYGPMGSITSAQSILAGSMRNRVDLTRRDDRLSLYLQNKYGDGSGLRGATARKEASYLAMEASRFLNSGLNVNNATAQRMTADFLSDPNNQERLNLITRQLAEQNVREAGYDLFNSASERTAISDVANELGNNDSQKSGAIQNFLQQYSTRTNLQKELDALQPTIGKRFIADDPNSYTGYIQALSDTQKSLRDVINKDPNSDAAKKASMQLDQIKSARSKLESMNDAYTAMRNAGVNSTAGDLVLKVNEKRVSNINKALSDNSLDAGLMKAFRNRDELARREKSIGSLADLEKETNGKFGWRSVLERNDIDATTQNLLINYYQNKEADGTTQADKINAILTGRTDKEQDKLLGVAAGLAKARAEGREDEFREANWKEVAQLEDATVGFLGSKRDTMRAYGPLEAAFAATGSTIGGQPISGEAQVGQVVDMLVQSDWGHLSTETRDTALSRIAYGMIASNTNAEQVVQYGGQAAKAAKEVGADSSSASLYGSQFALAIRQWQAKNGVADPLLASYGARAAGLAPKTLFGRGLNAILFNADQNKVGRIQDERSRAIVEKAMRGEQLSIEEMRVIESEHENILRDMGMGHAQIRNALERDYSLEEKQYQYVMNMGSRLMMAGSQLDELGAYGSARNSMQAAGSKFASKSQQIQEIFYKHAMNKEDLMKDNAGTLKQKIIAEARAAGASEKEIRELEKMDAIEYTNITNDVARTAANNAHTTVEEWQHTQQVAHGVDMGVNQIAADTWSSMYKGDNNAFSKALEELKNNPNADITDLFKAAVKNKLSDEEIDRATYSVAMNGLMGQPNSSIDKGLSDRQKLVSQNIMKKLVEAAGGNVDRVNELVRLNVNHQLKGKDAEEWNSLLENTDIGFKNINTFIDLVRRGKTIGENFINKQKKEQSEELDASQHEKVEAIQPVTNDNKGASASSTPAAGTTATNEKHDPNKRDGSGLGKELYVIQVPMDPTKAPADSPRTA